MTVGGIPAIENFVAHELEAQAEWVSSPASLLHWRDSRARKEVDLVFRRPTGEMLAVEVKSASTVTAAEARGLAAFSEAAAGSVVRSLIIYTGRVTQQLDGGIWAVPIASLFGPPAS